MNSDLEWLRQKAAAEEGQFVGAGGLVQEQQDGEDFTLKYPCGCEWSQGAMVNSCAEADRLWEMFRQTSGLITDPSWQPYRAHFLAQKTRTTMTLHCLECDAELVMDTSEQGQRDAYDLGWRLLRTRYRSGQLCPVHAEQWSRRWRKRRERNRKAHP